LQFHVEYVELHSALCMNLTLGRFNPGQSNNVLLYANVTTYVTFQKL